MAKNNLYLFLKMWKTAVFETCSRMAEGVSLLAETYPMLRDKQISLSFAGLDQEFWSARNRDTRSDLHALFQYPAMMVPCHQTEIVRLLKDVDPAIQTVLDPFVGAGTTLTACMQHGLSFCGQDINPLAILLCLVKARVYAGASLTEALDRILSSARCDAGIRLEAGFPALTKWFSPPASMELSRLRRAIRSEPDLGIRRFFWATLAETVRVTSNSRTSTYKLHIRPAPELAQLRSPLAVFAAAAHQATADARAFRRTLASAGVLDEDDYRGCIRLALGDTKRGIPHPLGTEMKYDMMLTSPPYGDNTSTIPYGQQAYLPLQWIDLCDIDEGLVDSSLLRTTQEIDRRSLGGRSAAVLDDTVRRLSDISPAFADIATKLHARPKDRLQRVASFVQDLETSLPGLLRLLRDNAYMVWFIGNRHVGGLEIPTNRVFAEIAAGHGVTLVDEFERTLSFRRMASRNRTATMMRTEYILILRKGRRYG